MDISTLVPLPVRILPDFCKREAESYRLMGGGVAVCGDLLVISCSKKLQVFALPGDIARGDLGTPRDLVPVRTLGGVAPMDFHFGSGSGYIAFTEDGGGERLLLVTDIGQGGRGAVHVIDVVRGTHVGYVAAPGAIMCPRGVATRKSLAAVTCCETGYSYRAAVRVFENSGAATWTPVREIFWDLSFPCGLRFTADGLRLVVTDYGHERLRIFCAQDGCLLRDIAAGDTPLDVEEWVIDDGGRAAWVMCHVGGLVAVAESASNTETVASISLGSPSFADGNFAFAPVPGLGLVVRHCGGVRFLATPDAVAMASMSSCKVAWMAAVWRGLVASRFAQET